MELDRRHRTVLKKIYELPYISYADLELLFRNDRQLLELVSYLEANKYIAFRNAASFEEDDGTCTLYAEPQTHLVALMRGNIYMENSILSNRRWRITTAIAVFAAIGAYRLELAWLLQAIAQLLK